MMDLKPGQLQPGQIVISKAGRDKGQTFVVLAYDGEYALLVDGRTRPLARPKRKKRKHIQHTLKVDAALAQAIKGNKYLKDSDFVGATALGRPVLNVGATALGRPVLEEENHG